MAPGRGSVACWRARILLLLLCCMCLGSVLLLKRSIVSIKLQYTTTFAHDRQRRRPSDSKQRVTFVVAKESEVNNASQAKATTNDFRRLDAALKKLYRECLERIVLLSNGDWDAFQKCALDQLEAAVDDKNKKLLGSMLNVHLAHHYKRLWQDDDDGDVPPPTTDATGSASNLLNSNTAEDASNTSPFTPESNRIRGLRLVLIGDSLTRYMYLSLVFYLRHGRWEPLSQRPSMVLEKTHSNWRAFYEYTNEQLGPNELCDCFREGRGGSGGGVNPQRIYENRYYWDPIYNNSAIYIQKFGEKWAQGRLTAVRINRLQRERQGRRGSDKATNDTDAIATSYTPPKWSKNWTGIILDYLVKLEPRPTHVVINSGKWVDNEIQNPTIVKAIVEALDQANMIGIYKTTTRSFKSYSTTLSLDANDYERRLCKALHECLDLSWTGRLTREFWWDWQHYREPVYRVMNERLLMDVLGYTRLHKPMSMDSFHVQPYGGNRTSLWIEPT